MSVELPARGFVFWPVGCGDSTTIKVNDNVFVQVDIHHMASSEDDNEPYHPVVDSLMDVLPEVDGKRYLAVFALTHADKDHCQGFETLMEHVRAGDLLIGELWATPRVFRDFEEKERLCDDAKAFQAEALRRVDVICGTPDGGDIASGDRVTIIGNDDVLKEDRYAGLPARYKRRPGEEITELDGVDMEGTFRAFLHAPFGDDSTAERNKTSLGMQVTLSEGEVDGRVMLLGDLDYPPVRRIFVELSEPENVEWDVFLAPHHCSKSVMYWQGEDDSEAVRQQDVLDAIETAAGDQGWVVASSVSVPSTNKQGDNPPHAVAKEAYQEIAPDGFLCTGDDPSPETDTPIVFEVSHLGVLLLSDVGTKESNAAAAVVAARGGEAPHGTTVGFGRC